MVKNIVIIGGGYAGIQVAKDLEKALRRVYDREHRIILIEKKTHFYHAVAALRCAVLDWDNRILIPYTNLFTNASNRVIQACAIELDLKEIIVDRNLEEFDNSNRIPYDYLVLATGTSYPAPAKAPTNDKESTITILKNLRSEIQNAESIVIVGGGPVGIELAGEIRQAYPIEKKEKKRWSEDGREEENKKKGKSITIIHNNNTLFADKAEHPKIAKKLLPLLEKHNINIVFDENAIIPDGSSNFYRTSKGYVTTRSSKTFKADLVLLAMGNRPGTDWLRSSKLGAEIIADNGYIKVKDTYQVDHPDLQNVYVLGDVANFDEGKLAYRVEAHSTVVVENLLTTAIYKAKPSAKYKKSPTPMLVTFGSKDGAGALPIFGELPVGGWLLSLVKGRSLFSSQLWSALNSKEPSR